MRLVFADIHVVVVVVVVVVVFVVAVNNEDNSIREFQPWDKRQKQNSKKKK